MTLRLRITAALLAGAPAAALVAPTLVVAALVASACSTEPAPGPETASAPAREPASAYPPAVHDLAPTAMRTLCAPVSGAVSKRVLVHAVSAGYEHEVARRPAPGELSTVERALVDLGRATGRFEAVVTRDPSAFEPRSLTTFDLVFFYTSGELPLSDAQRRSLLGWIEQGGAFAGAHCAADTYAAVPEYGAMLGARFDGHPWHEEVRVVVEDVGHPATRMLGDSFTITDEIYQFAAPWDRARVNVLLSLDPASVDVGAEGVRRADKDFALSWTKAWGKGRVFYTALGHRPEVWADERFLLHLAGGIAWALRDEPPAASAHDEVDRSPAGRGELSFPRAASPK